MGGVHQFGHNRLAGHSPGFLQQRKPFGTQPLKAVRACARLERTAAQNRSAGGLHPLGNAGDLFLAFNAAGAGHHGEMPAANFDRVFAADGDDRIVRVEFAVGFFIRFRDAAAALNQRIGQQPAFADCLGIADQAEDMGVRTDRIVDREAHRFQFAAERGHLIRRSVLFEDDNHDKLLFQ